MTNDSREIEELLARIAGGDASALESLHGLMADRLFGLTMSILKNRQESEDSLQETFLKIWKKSGSYDTEAGSALAWLLTITRNNAYDRYRRQIRQSDHMETIQNEIKDLAGSSETQPADDRFLGVERSLKIQEALNSLVQEQREAIEMAFFSGHTQMEVSEKLGVPLGTIKARIRRGMQSLKPYLTQLS